MPANWCPFCPGSGRVPAEYDVYLYPNDFPAFSPDTDPFESEREDLFGTNGPRGACDVVLYSPNHTLPPSELSVDNWRQVIELWTRRSEELRRNPDIAHICIFENCGEFIGVTMPHPHGQIYAMPFVSPIVEREHRAATEFAAAHNGACIFCDLLKQELTARDRIVAESESFVAFVPFAARFPAELLIYPRRHVRYLSELTVNEVSNLAQILSLVRRKYDAMFGFQLPLMMLAKQAPTKEEGAPYHFHMQFLPLQRSSTKHKYLASIETGFGTFLADTSPEDTAATLRSTPPADFTELR